MRSLGTTRLLIISLLGAEINAQACAYGTANEINGNWYCSAVKAITYGNFPGTGSYNKVTYMNASTGECSQQRYSYSGSLSPLNEELSIHIRGPTWLKQLAVYFPSSAHPKRSDQATFHKRSHGHHHLHHRFKGVREFHERDQGKRGVGDLVTAVIDGQLVSWTNVYGGPSAVSSSPTSIGAMTKDVNAKPLAPSTKVTTTITLFPVSQALATPSPIMPAKVIPEGTIDSWSRRAYYNAAAGDADGFTFLNHCGGTEGMPGTLDGGPSFGASLSYASPDGKSAAASSQVLSNDVLDDDVEVIIMSDQSCNDGGCGYTRPNGVAYHGFGGDHKIFLMEFSMPSTGKTGFNGDMPAIWLNNAQIPLTSQYGTNPDCSCWTSGCGEFDLFEILDSGNFRCKSTLHMAPAGGSSDYFERPVNNTIKAAVVFTGTREVAHIQILDDGQEFGPTLSTDVVAGFTSMETDSGDSALFELTP